MNQIDVGLAKALGNVDPGINSLQYAAARESAQTIARNQLKEHEKSAAAWRWLDAAMEVKKPSTEEEAALYDLLCRCRRERY